MYSYISTIWQPDNLGTMVVNFPSENLILSFTKYFECHVVVLNVEFKKQHRLFDNSKACEKFLCKFCFHSRSPRRRPPDKKG